MSFTGAFNFAAMCNRGVASSGEVVVLLDNDTEVVADDWLDEFVDQLARSEVGVVEALLLFTDGTNPRRAGAPQRQVRPITVDPLHRTPRRMRRRELGRFTRRLLRQRPGRVGDRALQDRTGSQQEPLAGPRRPRTRHPQIGRLVQPPPLVWRARPHPTSRVRRPPLPSKRPSRTG